MSRQFRSIVDRPSRGRRGAGRARGTRARRPRRGAAAHAGGHAAPLAARPKHTCLVMTGSGDPAFVKNFNPFTATGLPSGQFVRGAFYEGLTVSPEGGKPTLPWLARSWKWRTATRR